MKYNLWLLLLLALIFTGCETDEFVSPDEGGSKITFTFSSDKDGKTYAGSGPSALSESLNLSKLLIYMVGKNNQVESVFTSEDVIIDQGDAGTAIFPSVTVIIPGKVKTNKQFYFVANIASVVSQLSSIKKGSSLNDLLKLVTDTQDKHLSTAPGGLLLTGSVSVPAASFKAETSATVFLTRRVARFDISNHAAITSVTIRKIHIKDAYLSALAFTEKDSLPETKGDLPVINFEAFTSDTVKPNKGLVSNVFHMYPADAVSIEILAKVGNTEQLYQVPVPEDGIKANKRYTIRLKDTKKPEFEMTESDWDQNELTTISSIPVSNIQLNNMEGWDPETNRFDATANGTTITMDVFTRSLDGITHEILNAPEGYTIKVSSTTPTITYADVYKQEVTIEIDGYNGSGAMETEVLLKDKADPLKQIKITVYSEGYQGGILFSDASSTNVTGWNEGAYSFDATARATVITLTVLTQSMFGATYEVADAPAGYTPQVTLGPILMNTYAAGAYKQQLMITVPEYTGTAAMKIGVVVKDNADKSKTRTVTILSDGYTGGVSFANASSTNSAGWTADTYRYDATAKATTITMDVITPSSQGAIHEVTGAPDGYTLTVSWGTVSALSDGTYKQSLKITVPEYVGTAAMEARVVVKDKAQPSKTKTVTIFSVMGDYYPAAHSGWAGCNIYYDEAKGHLTFDDVGVTEHEQYHGVFFQWGSLWGISAQGGWSITTVLYPPTGGIVAAFEGPVSSSWHKIPHSDNPMSTPPPGIEYSDWGYIYQITNGDTGIGDICKWLTDKEWAPAGKKWRMPTANEFGKNGSLPFGTWTIGNNYSNVAAGTNPIGNGRFITNVTPNVFFPAAGDRNSAGDIYSKIGEYGSYWSSSPTLSFGFNNSNVYPPDYGIIEIGRSVRCVAE